MGSKMIGRGLPGRRESPGGWAHHRVLQTIVLSLQKISDKYLKFHKSWLRKKPLLPSCLYPWKQDKQEPKVRVLGSSKSQGIVDMST